MRQTFLGLEARETKAVSGALEFWSRVSALGDIFMIFLRNCFLFLSVAFSPQRARLCMVATLEIRYNIVQCVCTCSKHSSLAVVL